MSKKEFKKAIGGLYKAGSIQITAKGIQIHP
jgi:predicted RNA-binding protein (virulence factor B family)